MVIDGDQAGSEGFLPTSATELRMLLDQPAVESGSWGGSNGFQEFLHEGQKLAGR
jgi:hypothetical protein